MPSEHDGTNAIESAPGGSSCQTGSACASHVQLVPSQASRTSRYRVPVHRNREFSSQNGQKSTPFLCATDSLRLLPMGWHSVIIECCGATCDGCNQPVQRLWKVSVLSLQSIVVEALSYRKLKLYMLAVSVLGMPPWASKPT